MRSRTSHTISGREVHEWALNWLLAADLLKDHGWLCTAGVVWSVVLRAAARLISVSAAGVDLFDGPSGQAVFDASADGLPTTRNVLERRLNESLTGDLTRAVRGRAQNV